MYYSAGVMIQENAIYLVDKYIAMFIYQIFRKNESTLLHSCQGFFLQDEMNNWFIKNPN